MKKLLALLLVLLSLLALTACTDGPLVVTATPAPTPVSYTHLRAHET